MNVWILHCFIAALLDVMETAESNTIVLDDDTCTYSGKYGSCTSSFYCCRNSACIKNNLVCNGADDCGDGSDEDGCPKCSFNGKVDTCGQGYFCCQSGQCIPNNWVCNAINDCGHSDTSDETQCPKCVYSKNTGQDTCGVGFYCCANGRCVPNSWVCDDSDDCTDNSDEEHCLKKHAPSVGGLDTQRIMSTGGSIGFLIGMIVLAIISIVVIIMFINRKARVIHVMHDVIMTIHGSVKGCCHRNDNESMESREKQSSDVSMLDIQEKQQDNDSLEENASNGYSDTERPILSSCNFGDLMQPSLSRSEQCLNKENTNKSIGYSGDLRRSQTLDSKRKKDVKHFVKLFSGDKSQSEEKLAQAKAIPFSKKVVSVEVYNVDS